MPREYAAHHSRRGRECAAGRVVQLTGAAQFTIVRSRLAHSLLTRSVLGAITLLLVYQLLGEILVLALGLPVPGPVIGLALLFLTLAARGGVSEELRTTANGILAHLSLLFVPAGVGVMVHLARLRDEWLPIAIALVGSTALTIALTALAMQWFARLAQRPGKR